jgi:hypothetical protein
MGKKKARDAASPVSVAGNGQRDIHDQPLWASRIEEAALVLVGGLDVALHPALVVWFRFRSGE